MKAIVFDIETDGLDPTKIHCLSYYDGSGKPTTVFTEEGILQFFDTYSDTHTIVGHFITGYDFKALKKLVPTFEQPTDYIDTLGLSWYLFPERDSHGLDEWGNDIGIKKPKVDDWENLTPEEYAYRCEQDCLINWTVFQKCMRKLREIYGDETKRILDYLNFKMECLVEQADVRIPLDYDRAVFYRDQLLEEKKKKTDELKGVMPKVPKYKTKVKPKITHKKDGTLSVKGEEWFALLKKLKLPATHKDPIDILDGYEEPNPNSTQQVKSWLFSLGWKPCTYKYNKDKSTGKEKKVEQVRYFSLADPRKGELTDSVLALKEKEPAIEVLEGLTVITHRLSVFQGFITHAKKDADGNYYLISSAGGFTNTLRLQHRAPIANLPKVSVPWGEEIRSCLVSHKSHSCVGSDMVSLESTTKRHYMKPLDPEYVEEMSKPGFDEHLDLAVHAGAITVEDSEKHKAKELDLSSVRRHYKQTNYSAIYGIGPPKLARELGTTEWKAAELLAAYWERNWAVRELVKDLIVKVISDGSMWLFNPVSEFWYSLRFEKDKFSTLNQSTGVYCFDTWVAFVRKTKERIMLQYHDEILVDSVDTQATEGNLKWAIEKTNDKIKLNVPLDIDIKVGKNYAEVH